MSKAKLPQRILNEDGSVTLHLKDKIKWGEEVIESLTFKKPKAKHLRKVKFDDMDMDQVLNLAGTLCGQAPSAMDELEMADVGAVMGVMNDFLDEFGETGKTG